jgi:hypothetical protein
MTNSSMSVAAPAADDATDETIEITEDMIVELGPDERRGKLLHLPPPIPGSETRRRRRGVFRVTVDN